MCVEDFEKFPVKPLSVNIWHEGAFCVWSVNVCSLLPDKYRKNCERYFTSAQLNGENRCGPRPVVYVYGV